MFRADFVRFASKVGLAHFRRLLPFDLFRHGSRTTLPRILSFLLSVNISHEGKSQHIINFMACKT
jgi:hypothetical protein